VYTQILQAVSVPLSSVQIGLNLPIRGAQLFWKRSLGSNFTYTTGGGVQNNSFSDFELFY
jgi:hypothetical protein